MDQKLKDSAVVQERTENQNQVRQWRWKGNRTDLVIWVGRDRKALKWVPAAPCLLLPLAQHAHAPSLGNHMESCLPHLTPRLPFPKHWASRLALSTYWPIWIESSATYGYSSK